jgi:hypothetical protein
MKQLKVTSKEPNRIVPDLYNNKIKIIKVKNTTVIVK